MSCYGSEKLIGAGSLNKAQFALTCVLEVMKLEVNGMEEGHNYSSKEEN